MRKPGFIIDVPVTLSVAVRGASREAALVAARAFAESLAPTDQYVEGYSETMEKLAGITITEVSLESSMEDSCEVLEELEEDHDEEELERQHDPHNCSVCEGRGITQEL